MTSFVEKNKKLLFSFVLFIFTLLPAHVFAISISPASINIEQSLVRDNKVKQSFTLIKSENNKTSYYKAKVRKGSDFVDFDNDIVKIEKDESRSKFIFYIHPKTAVNGDHQIEFSFVPVEDADTGQQGAVNVSAKAGVSAKVNFTVTDEEISRFDVRETKIQDSEEGDKLVMNYGINNTGNIDVKPDSIEIKIYKKGNKSKPIYEGVISGEKIPVVGATKDKEFISKLDNKLERGEYVANISFKKGDKLVHEKKDISFGVFPQGTLLSRVKFESFDLNKKIFSPGEQIKIEAVAKNTGQTRVTPELVVDIEKDGKTIENLSKSKKEIAKEASVKIPVSTRVSEPGTYLVTGYFKYGIKKSPFRNLTFTVKESEKKSNIVMYSSMGLLVVFMVLALWIIKKKVKN